MPVYATIGGTQRELSSVPAMVNGAQRELQSFLATVGGVQRELLAAKTRWERYKVKTATSYEMEKSGTSSKKVSRDDNNCYVYAYSSCTMNQTDGTFTLSGAMERNRPSSTRNNNQETIDEFLAAGLVWWRGSATNENSDSPSASIYAELSSVYKITGGTAGAGYITWLHDIYIAKPVETQERGSYIDTVEDSSADAYPDNGAQGGYWYVKITEDVKPKQLNYIQTSGTQYVNLGFVPDANTEVEMDFQLTTAGTTNSALFAVNGQFSFRWYGASSVFRSNGSNNVDFPTGISGTARHTVVKNPTKCTLDGTYSVNNTAGNVALPLYLMAQNANGSVSNYAKGRVYRFKRRQAGVLTNDLVPWQTAAGDIGLMDVLTDTFYGNAGTGVFTGG